MAPSASLETPSSLPSWPRISTIGDAGDVAHQDRLREVVGDPAEAGQAGHEEDDPHHDREQRRQRGVLRRCQPAASGAIAVATSSDTVPSGPTTTRGADPRTAYASTGQQQGVEPGADRDPGQLGVGHRRRQGQCRDRDTRNDIGPQPRPRVRRRSNGRRARTGSSSAVDWPTRTRRDPRRPR